MYVCFGAMDKKKGLSASKYDPCLFFGPYLIVIIYVDDILIYGKDDDVINGFIMKMHSEDITLNKVSMAEGCLGINIQHTNTQINLTQSGLSIQITSALGHDANWSTSCDTPTECSLLAWDIDAGKKGSGKIDYATVVGMLL
jgi:hypothetical protein